MAFLGLVAHGIDDVVAGLPIGPFDCADTDVCIPGFVAVAVKEVATPP